MTDRPTQLEGAFGLASSGAVNDTKEIKAQLRSEGYSENGQVHGRTLMAQLTKLIAGAEAESNA
jgi:hypothetical protein